MNNISSVGVDIVNIPRFRTTIDKWGEKFLKRIFTEEELIYCFKRKNPFPSLAVRFAAKEAFLKAYRGESVRYRDIEVAVDDMGKPFYRLKGMPVQQASVSLSHERDYAVAVVVIEGGAK